MSAFEPQPVWVGLSLMNDDAFRVAALPLLAAGEVDALEWSFDTGWGAPLPAWLAALLAHYAAAGRLLGHGVHYSPLSATWEDRQERWLDALSRELEQRPYVQVSEHYGFMTAPPFVRGAPLPAPRGDALLTVARDRLARLRARLSCPLGLENLAVAISRDEALAHGAFLDALLAPSDFIVLDLHNLYCQAVNFDLDPLALLATFPLARVRELHVSGGSWQPAWPSTPDDPVRCDTHDGGLPGPVFALLRAARARCPNLRAVIVEQLGHALVGEAEAARFRDDFRRVRAIVGDARGATPALPSIPDEPMPAHWSHADVPAMAAFQSALLSLLAQDLDAAVLCARLAEEPVFAPFRAELASADPRALGIMARAARKWLRVRAPAVTG